MTSRPNIKLDAFERALRDDPPVEKAFERLRKASIGGWKWIILWSTVGLLVLWVWASLFAGAYHWQ